MSLGFILIGEPSAERIMRMMQSHLIKVGGPVHQILLRVLWGSFSCPATLGLCPELRYQPIHLKGNHSSPLYWVADKLLFLLALSHTWVERGTVQV